MTGRKTKKLIPLSDPNQVPSDMTEEEARLFWETHEITDEYLEKAGFVSENDLPPVRIGRRPSG